jgi:hypothetical protein
VIDTGLASIPDGMPLIIARLGPAVAARLGLAVAVLLAGSGCGGAAEQWPPSVRQCLDRFHPAPDGSPPPYALAVRDHHQSVTGRRAEVYACWSGAHNPGATARLVLQSSGVATATVPDPVVHADASGAFLTALTVDVDGPGDGRVTVTWSLDRPPSRSTFPGGTVTVTASGSGLTVAEGDH